jgi:hypothetical protein
MKTIEYKNLENITGGSLGEGFCYGIGGVGGVYALGGSVYALTSGAVANFWNPVGWVLGIAALVTIGCVTNGMLD